MIGKKPSLLFGNFCLRTHTPILRSLSGDIRNGSPDVLCEKLGVRNASRCLRNEKLSPRQPLAKDATGNHRLSTPNPMAFLIQPLV